MKKNGGKNRYLTKIVCATVSVIFSLGATATGAYAWFINALTYDNTASSFAVTSSGDCGIYSISLLKFDYSKQEFGSGSNKFISIDYLNPETGDVNRYDYNEDNFKFGYFENGYRQWNGTQWVTTNIKPATGTYKDTIGSSEDLPGEKSAGDYYILNEPKYYAWNGADWDIATAEPSGLSYVDKGSLSYLYQLPNPIPAEEGDYYQVTSESDKYFQWDGESWGEGLVDAPSAEGSTNKGVLEDKDRLFEAGWYYLVENTTWNNVETMNIYDPVDKLIFGSQLKDLNCNAVYEVVLESGVFTDAYLNALVLKATKPDYADDSALYLTKCADFDIFFPSDLLSSNALFHDFYCWNGSKWVVSLDEPTGDVARQEEDPVSVNDLPTPVVPEADHYYSYDSTYYTWNEGTSSWDSTLVEPEGTEVVLDSADGLLNAGYYYEVTDDKPYYPSYIPKNTVLTAEEEIYYKISFLSSLKDTHGKFYGGSATQINLTTNEAVTFTGNPKYLTLYINVNYAPSQLDELYATSVYQNDFRYIYDFMFKFVVDNRNGGA